MKKVNRYVILSFLVGILMLSCLFVPSISASADTKTTMPKSSILIERSTGKVLQEHNSHSKLPIASVTKLMTILLTLEKVQANEIALTDKVMVSENAHDMGGSQIFLDANKEYVLSDLLKSVVVASANDSSVAIAEHIAGSEQNFVSSMNERAVELNMLDTHYSNCTGLPTSDGVSSAFDQAILLNQVLNFEKYREFASVWNEDFVHPDGRTTQMTNTNKLSRFYTGCIGGKTGSTNQAKYCLAVGAKRNNMELISVVLGAENSKDRFKFCSDQLNFGFDNFETKTLLSIADLSGKTVKIKGQDRCANLTIEKEYSTIVKRGENVNFSLNFNLPDMLKSVKQGDVVGNVAVIVDGVEVETIDILSADTIKESSFWDYFKDIVNA